MTDDQKKLTIKQRKWLLEYIKTGNATEAAMLVYDCKDRDSASNIGYENMRKLDYVDFMEEAGITDALLHQKLLEGLSANKQLGARIVVKKNSPTSQANGELPVANGQTDDFIEVEDYAVRHKYLETGLKLKGRLVNKTDITSGGEKIIDVDSVLDRIYGSKESGSPVEVPTDGA